MATKRRLTTKVVVLGDTNVGKTCLLQRYVKNTFTSAYKMTIGADFMTKELIVEDRHVGLSIWDTAGQERFHSLAVSFYRGADACILVFDITDRESFQHLDKWRADMLENANCQDPDNFPFIVIGTKLDLEDSRTVSRQEAEHYAQELRVPYFEVSSKEGTNVDAAFLEIAIKTKEQADKADMVFNSAQIDDDAVVDIAKEEEDVKTDQHKKKKSGGCCS